MNKLYLLAIILLQASTAMAQLKDKTAGVLLKDSTLRKLLMDPYYCNPKGNPRPDYLNKFYYTDQQYITNYSMNRLIRKDITKITLGEDGLPVLGNYASLKYSADNSNITLNTSLYNPFQKPNENDPIRNILSINVKASITDGASSLFSNTDFNSGIGIKAKMSFLTRKTLYVNSSTIDCNTLKYYRENLYYNYIHEKEDYYLQQKLTISDYANKTQKLSGQIKTNNELIAFLKNEVSLKNLLLDFPNLTIKDIEKLTTKDIATLQIKRDSAQLKLLDVEKNYRLYMNQNPLQYNENSIIDSYYKQLQDLETKNAKWEQFRIEFWDINVNLAGDKYNVFTKSLPVGKQLGKNNFTTWSIGTAFNHFASNNDISFLKSGIFYKIGYALSDNNNLIGTKTKSITNTTTIDTPGFKREVVDNVNAYNGPLKKYFAHTITGQLSKYLDDKKSNALSFYTSLIQNFNVLDKPFDWKDKPNWTLGTGYSFALLDKDKEKAVINLELFFNFDDVLNSLKDNSKFYQRKEIGLKIGIPFNSIFLNQE